MTSLSQVSSVLVANRGEIACRVMRTAQHLGLRCAAVYSDADVNAEHVAMADAAVRIGPAAASESYLHIPAIIDAALQQGVDAVHPGYGFLSENADFVEAVEAAGLIFVGPSANAIRAMGLKDNAKRLMQEAGVPVVPGYHGEVQDVQTLQAAAQNAGYPVLIKARAGGGGKGMRRVDDDAFFIDALAAARREAAGAFGDDAVLIEKYISSPRHIEVQIFGDTHGEVVHLYERDCSLQRRHQKVLEEAPAPGLSEVVRTAMTEAAVRAARAIDYAGAGTIEFIVDGSDEPRVDGFWFMEMNTRLQVEHPVTEAITGVDLVEWQLRVAAGEALPLSQDEIPCVGHAVEVRLYAEDVASGFLPQTGTLDVFEPVGGACVFDELGLRVDSGVRSGDEISPHYDPMIAKLIAYAPDRAAALKRLAGQLGDTIVLNSITNRAMLSRLVALGSVQLAQLDTGLIERELASLVDQAPDEVDEAIAAWLLVSGQARPPSDTLLPRSDAIAGFRLWEIASREVSFGDPLCHMRVQGRRDQWSIARYEEPDSALELTLVEFDQERCRATLAVAGQRHRIAWSHNGSVLEVQRALSNRRWSLVLPGQSASKVSAGDSLIAPMPGRVLYVHVQAGDSVNKGQCLVVLEAMKMEHQLLALRDGEVAEVSVSVGDQTTRGAVVLSLLAET